MSPVRIELVEANAFVTKHHRHHKPVRGHQFSVGAEHQGKLVGVVIVGRPVARAVDQKYVGNTTVHRRHSQCLLVPVRIGSTYRTITRIHENSDLYPGE